MLIFLLTACGSTDTDQKESGKLDETITQEDIIGTWVYSENFNDNSDFTHGEKIYVFEADGTYSYEGYLDGEYAAYDNGTYTKDINKLILHSSVSNEDIECIFSGDKLVIFDNEYTKAE